MENTPDGKFSNHSTSDYSWLVSITTAIFLPLTGLIPFLATAALQGTINPEEWNKWDTAKTTMLLIVFSAFGASIYAAREFDINFKGHISQLINLYEYKEKEYIDYLLAHYGNVCSLAALSAAFMFGTRNTVTSLGITTPSVFASIVAIIATLLYGIIFLKATIGAIHRKRFAIIALIISPIIDTSLVRMAIKSIPN